MDGEDEAISPFLWVIIVLLVILLLLIILLILRKFNKIDFGKREPQSKNIRQLSPKDKQVTEVGSAGVQGRNSSPSSTGLINDDTADYECVELEDHLPDKTDPEISEPIVVTSSEHGSEASKVKQTDTNTEPSRIYMNCDDTDQASLGKNREQTDHVTLSDQDNNCDVKKEGLYEVSQGTTETVAPPFYESLTKTRYDSANTNIMEMGSLAAEMGTDSSPQPKKDGRFHYECVELERAVPGKADPGNSTSLSSATANISSKTSKPIVDPNKELIELSKDLDEDQEREKIYMNSVDIDQAGCKQSDKQIDQGVQDHSCDVTKERIYEVPQETSEAVTPSLYESLTDTNCDHDNMSSTEMHTVTAAVQEEGSSSQSNGHAKTRAMIGDEDDYECVEFEAHSADNEIPKPVEDGLELSKVCETVNDQKLAQIYMNTNDIDQ